MFPFTQESSSGAITRA